MRIVFDKLPGWLRWVLLIPLTLFLGWFVAIAILYGVSHEAASEDAPIMYFAWVVSSLGGNYSSMYFAYEIAPSHKLRVVFCFMAVAVFFALFNTYEAYTYRMIDIGLRAVGQLLAVGLALKYL